MMGQESKSIGNLSRHWLRASTTPEPSLPLPFIITRGTDETNPDANIKEVDSTSLRTSYQGMSQMVGLKEE